MKEVSKKYGKPDHNIHPGSQHVDQKLWKKLLRTIDERCEREDL